MPDAIAELLSGGLVLTVIVWTAVIAWRMGALVSKIEAIASKVEKLCTVNDARTADCAVCQTKIQEHDRRLGAVEGRLDGLEVVDA